LEQTFSDGDFNYNQTVEIADFAILASRFNTRLSDPPASTMTFAPLADPEMTGTSSRVIDLLTDPS
jgi:hypothetical protein